MRSESRGEAHVDLAVLGERGPIAIEGANPWTSRMLAAWAGRLGRGMTCRFAGGLEHDQLEALGAAWGHELHRMLPTDASGRGEAVEGDAWVACAFGAGTPQYHGELPVPVWEQVLRLTAQGAGISLHVQVRRGRDPHTVMLALMRAFAEAVLVATGVTEGAETHSHAGARRSREGPQADEGGVDEVDVAGASHLSAAMLAGASQEVRKGMRKRELPEVKAARERDRDIHGSKGNAHNEGAASNSEASR